MVWEWQDINLANDYDGNDGADEILIGERRAWWEEMADILYQAESRLDLGWGKIAFNVFFMRSYEVFSSGLFLFGYSMYGYASAGIGA